VKGAADILSSFRKTSESGRARLDSLRFEHTIDDARPFEIQFVDILRVADDELTVRHTMHVRIGDDERIEHLRLEGPPGQSDAVAQFFTRHRR
jgi:hypothetical protein